MKKNTLIGILIFTLIFVQIFSFQVQASSDLQGVGDDLEGKVGEFETAKENVETKWDYLGKEWQNILLKNKFVVGVDNFLKKINFVFVFLFGEDYSLSLTLLVIIVLWIYLFLELSEILKDFTMFSPGTSKIIGLGVTIISAQVGILRKFTQAFGWIIFSPEAWWMRFIIFIVVCVILIFLHKITCVLGKKHKESKEKQEKAEAKTERKTLKKYFESFIKAFGGK